MQSYFVVEGRSSRRDFWLFFVGIFAMLLAATVVDAVAFGQPSLFFVVVGLVHLVPFITASVRRLHDADLSGWLYLMNALPFGQVIFIILTCLPTTVGANKYGDAQDGQQDASRPASRYSSVAREPAFSTAASIPAVAPNPASTAVPQRQPAASLDPSALDQLERLSSLRASGVLTDTEFATLKAKLLPSA